MINSEPSGRWGGFHSKAGRKFKIFGFWIWILDFWIDQFQALWKVGRDPFKGWPKIWAPSCRPFTFLRLKSWHPEYFFQTANTFWGILGRKYVSYKWQLKLILAKETKLSKFVFHGRIFGYYILSNLQNIKCPEYDRRLGGTAV